MKSIQFKKHYRSYNPGEIAHFEDDLADKLITAGVATDAPAATAADGSIDARQGKPDKKAQPKVTNAQPD